MVTADGTLAAKIMENFMITSIVFKNVPAYCELLGPKGPELLGL